MTYSVTDSSTEQMMMFDTIVIRRPTGTTGDSNGTYYINLRELQMWVNNSNVYQVVQVVEIIQKIHNMTI